MSNKDESESKSTTEQLNVRIPQELLRRVSAVAAALGVSLGSFVANVLDERTRDHKSDIEKIRNREKMPKR